MNKRLHIWRRQRSAGRHILGPVYIHTQWHSHNGVRFINISIGNPRTHYRWAFNAYLYLTGV